MFIRFVNDVLLHHVIRLFSFDLTKRITFNDRRIVRRNRKQLDYL